MRVQCTYITASASAEEAIAQLHRQPPAVVVVVVVVCRLHCLSVRLSYCILFFTKINTHGISAALFSRCTNMRTCAVARGREWVCACLRHTTATHTRHPCTRWVKKALSVCAMCVCVYVCARDATLRKSCIVIKRGAKEKRNICRLYQNSNAYKSLRWISVCTKTLDEKPS